MKIYSRCIMIVNTVLNHMDFDNTIDELIYNSFINTFSAKYHVE